MNTPKYSRLDPGQRREQILDAAGALFAQRAYDDVSIEDIAGAAGVTRGLVHHYVARTSTSGCSSGSAPSASRNSGRPSVAAPVRALPIQCRAGLTGPRPTERSGSPRSPPVRTSQTPTSGKWSPTSYAEPSRGSRSFTPTSPRTSPRLRHALECWTALNRAATRRWLQGEATREATHELLASTLEHVLRTFGARPAPGRRASPP
jgi:Bacterial regulatory proteins, tetR family